jgi:hypothetical protein
MKLDVILNTVELKIMGEFSVIAACMAAKYDHVGPVLEFCALALVMSVINYYHYH